MAKQPQTEQIDQLIKDLSVTIDKTAFPRVREAAEALLPVAHDFRDKLRSYRKVTP
jgi:hypothetical protein